jgi:hypothetical protein
MMKYWSCYEPMTRLKDVKQQTRKHINTDHVILEEGHAHKLLANHNFKC